MYFVLLSRLVSVSTLVQSIALAVAVQRDAIADAAASDNTTDYVNDDAINEQWFDAPDDVRLRAECDVGHFSWFT